MIPAFLPLGIGRSRIFELALSMYRTASMRSCAVLNRSTLASDACRRLFLLLLCLLDLNGRSVRTQDLGFHDFPRLN